MKIFLNNIYVRKIFPDELLSVDETYKGYISTGSGILSPNDANETYLYNIEDYEYVKFICTKIIIANNYAFYDSNYNPVTFGNYEVGETIFKVPTNAVKFGVLTNWGSDVIKGL